MVVKPVYEYRFDPKLFESLRCPTCKLRLDRIRLLDLFVQGLACENGHRFFIDLRSPNATESAKGSLIEGPRETEPSEIIKAWLTQDQFRSYLNDQLATIIRRIHEISVSKLHIPFDGSTASPRVFRYCVLCAEPLEFFQQGDAWVEGLRCTKSHEFRHRNGLTFSFEGEMVRFHEEMADGTLPALVDGWLEGTSELANQIPKQIKPILEDYRKRQVG